MARPLAVLIVEDVESDAQLIVRMLTKAGYTLTFEQVESAAQMRQALEKQAWEIVISDFSMPELDGFAALKLLQETGLDIPFIVVSGTMGEETAVDMMKAGAQDYVMKGSLARLVPAVERELKQAETRRERKQAEEALGARELQHRTLLETAMDGFWLVDLQGRLLEVNDTYCRMSGYSEQELLGMRIPDLESKEVFSDTASHIQKVMEHGEDRFESRHHRKDGSIFEVEISVQYRPEDGGRMVAFLRDITERKLAEIINRLIFETRDKLLRSYKMEDICQLVSEKVRDLIGDGITATSMLDEEHQTVRMVSYHGLDVPIEKLISILGIDAYTDMSLDDMSEEDLKIYRSGRLEILAGGLYTLVTRMVPKPACLMVEKLLRVNKIYTMGFIHEKKHMGGLIILARSDITPYISAIEKIVELAIIAMERKRTEEILRDSEARYRMLFQGTTDGILIADLESRMFRYANPAICRLLGYSEAELQTMGVSDIHPKADLPAVLAEFEAQARGDKTLAAGLPCLRKDGTIVYADVSAVALSIDDRLSNVGFFRDITERKRAEAEIQSLARFPSENPGPILRIALDGTLLYVNPAGLSQLPEWHLQTGEAALPMLREATLQAIKDETTQERNLEYGEQVYSFYVAPIIAAGYANLYGRDITERKQAEEALRESEELFRSAFESSVAGISMVAADGKFIEVNDKLCELLGRGRKELIQLSFSDITYEEDIEVGSKYLKQMIAGELENVSFEKRYIKKGGNVIWVFLSISAIRDKQKKLQYFVTYTQDITERIAAAEKLQSSLVGTVNTVAMILEARDPYTSGHQKRVAEISVAIAKELGLPEEQIQGIYFSSLIHDLGKIQVPAEILSKPGKLTRLEFDMIKTHSKVGHELLKEIEFPWPIAEIVYQHHERVNGSGYPRKLKGNRISIEAKIIGTADVIEAMSSHRPYRPALGLEAALDEINKNKGILYDPDIVEAFIKVIKKDKTLLPSTRESSK